MVVFCLEMTDYKHQSVWTFINSQRNPELYYSNSFPLDSFFLNTQKTKLCNLITHNMQDHIQTAFFSNKITHSYRKLERVTKTQTTKRSFKDRKGSRQAWRWAACECSAQPGKPAYGRTGREQEHGWFPKAQNKRGKTNMSYKNKSFMTF